MRVLQDKERDLIWYNFNPEQDLKFAYIMRKLDNFLNTVDKWGEHPSVQKFLGSGKPLGHFMKGLCESIPDYELHFGTNSEGRLVTALVTSINDVLKLSFDLEKHLFNGNDEKSNNEEFITKEHIRKILSHKDENNLYLAYNVVDPDCHGQGIGTRVLQSVKNNLEYFAGCKTSNLQMNIDNENTASIKVVIKNGFQRLKPSTHPITNSSMFYCHTTNLDKDELTK